MARATRSRVGGTTGNPSVTPRANSSSDSSRSLIYRRGPRRPHKDGGGRGRPLQTSPFARVATTVAPAKPALEAVSSPQDDRDDDGGQDQAIDDERLERPALQIADQEPHGEPAADEGRDDGDQQRSAFSRAQAMTDEAQGLVASRGRGDGNAEEEREARGRGALQAGEEAGRDGDPGSRRARNQGQGLRATNGHGPAPAHALQRIARCWRGLARGPVGDPDDDAPEGGREGHDE